jgi:tetratricopeptide (TPR) repeat protein
MRRLPTLLLALLAVVAPGRPGRCAETPSEPAELVEIPAPNLEGADPSVARRILDELARAREAAADPAASAAERAQAFGELGQTLLLYDRLEAAEVAFENAAALTPADHKPHYYLGVIEQTRGRLDESREHFRRVLDLDPGYLAALVRLGDIERAANRAEQASAFYRRALEVQPTSPAAHWGLGQLAMSAGDSRQAVAHFEAVLAAQPEATATHYPLALAYRSLGRTEEAERHLAQRGDRPVRPLDPLIDGLAQRAAGASLYVRQGNTAYSRGDFEGAARAYREAVAAAPDDTTARHALATSLARLGRTVEALEQLEIVVEQRPQSGVAHYNLGTMYSQGGDPERAVEHFRRALELAPDLADARFNLALLLEQQGQLEEALEQYAEVRRRDPQDAGAAIRHASLAARLGAPGEAEADLRRMLSVDPGSVEAGLALGGVLVVAGRPEEALAQYRQVLDGGAGPQGEARARLEIGRLLMAGGEAAAAVEELERTVELMPGIVEARMTLAEALSQALRFEEAAAQFDVVSRQQPGLLGAHLGRAVALLRARQDGRARDSLEGSLAALPERVELTDLLSRVLSASAEAQVRDGARALELAQSTYRDQPSPRHAETLAMALAELGRFEEAVHLQAQIHRAAFEAGSPDLTAIERRLRSYENRQPERSPWLRGSGG